MAELPEDGPNTAAETEGILGGLGAGQGRRGGRGSGKKKQSFKTSFNDMDDTSKAVIEGLKNVQTSAPTGESVAAPSRWKVQVSDRPGMATSISVPGARKRNHFDDFEDLHDDLESAVMALGATVKNIPASKEGAGMSEEQQRGVYELARSELANASAHMANAGVNHTAGYYVRGGVKLEKSQPKADKGIYEIANEVTPLVPGEYIKKTTALTGKEGPKSAADHMKLAAAAYGQVGNLLSEASRNFGQKFKNSYGKTGQSYGTVANEIADDYAKRLSRDPGYASTINTGSDKAWEPFSVKPIERIARTLFPGAVDHDINASRTVQAATDIQAATARKMETGSMRGTTTEAPYVSPGDVQRSAEIDAAKAHWASKNPEPQLTVFSGDEDTVNAAREAHATAHRAWAIKRNSHALNISAPGKARAYLASEGAEIPNTSIARGTAPSAPRTAIEAQSGINAQKISEQEEAYKTYLPNIAVSAESETKRNAAYDLADRQAASAEKAAGAAEGRSRVDAKAKAIADAHDETFHPMTEMYNGVQDLALDAQEKGVELHKDVFKHLGNAFKAFGGHSAQVTRGMPYLADVTKHTDRAMDEVTNAARRLQQSGVNHPLLTQIVQDGSAQLAAGKYAGRLRTINNAGFSAKPTINTSAITNLPRQ